MSHTPGPWFAGKHGVIHAGEEKEYARGKTRDQLVMVCAGPNRDADTALIAAAPELLANLEFAVKLLGPLLGATAQVEHMRTIIAKAKP